MAAEQETQEDVPIEETANGENPQPAQENYTVEEEIMEHNPEQVNSKKTVNNSQGEDRSGFLHGLSVGLGIGCIATFIIMWVAVFFTPMMPAAISYEALLAVFIYPMIYLLAVGLIALTAGIVREYYARRSHF